MSLTPEIIALLLLDTVFLLFGGIAFVLSAGIAWRWRSNETTELQYALHRRSYLVSVIINYIFMLKIPLFAFFIYTCDKLSAIITGAMCASGVVNSVDFGLYLTLFKIVNLYVFGFWLLLNDADMNDEKLPFTRLKFILFMFFFIPLCVEIGLEIGFFTSLNVSKIVSCCGTLFSASSTSSISLLFSVDEKIWMMIFYGCFALSVAAYVSRSSLASVVSNLLLALFALIALILFFSPYVYELPTHHCPFCLLQKEYFYVGYLLYALLFSGTFYAAAGGVLDLVQKRYTKRFYRLSLFFNTVYVIGISLYPLSYYLRNGVWL
ncbi:hypothetical protein [Sulfurospirillum sp. hDNRA2]|uniref:hypothetical protein n=1 Tax=Sulfurospirillum sp. hDNRA2 TaxID=3237298 RepID=UPI0020B7509E|nr:hypothetical protein [Sulfurospirillum sp. DNRA8]MCP3652759.1 hypothetical protein [Sulfurospirillum sp. DNRA8]MCR1811611.1 hypothetical protein [Sulfurospirillum sp. DNRA8]